MEKLNVEIIFSRIAHFHDWRLVNDKLEKTFTFPDFTNALEFVNKIGNISEEMDHHPDILIHNWNKVKFTLSTHSVDGITELDLLLLKRIESIYAKFK